MKRVAILTPWFPNTPGEQPGAFIAASAEAVAKRGWHVEAFVARPYVPPPLSRFAHTMIRGKVEANKFSVLASVRELRYLALPRFGRLGPLRGIRDRTILSSLLPYLERARPDVLHAHTEDFTAVAAEAARIAKIPFVVTLHGIDTRLSAQSAEPDRRRIGAALALAQRIILVGDPLRPFVSSLNHAADRIDVVHNGFDPPPCLRPRPILSGNVVKFVAVSNLHEGKGLDIAIRALALVKRKTSAQWHFRIAGDGNQSSELVALAHGLKLQDDVTFLGEIRHDRVFDELHRNDVFLLPSYREAFGIAYLEAMAAGLIAIGVRGEGPAAYIEHRTSGFLTDPRSVEGLAQILLEVVDGDRNALRQLATRGQRHVVERFSWAAHAERLTAIYANASGEWRP